jgi:hypothetical protein
VSENELRNALLQKDGPAPANEELKLLRGLIDAERRRAGRLANWSVAAWAGWGVCLALMLLLPHWMASHPMPAGQARLPADPPGALLSLALSTFSIMLIVGAICLPVVGVVLLILYFIASRSAMSRNMFALRLWDSRKE